MKTLLRSALAVSALVAAVLPAAAQQQAHRRVVTVARAARSAPPLTVNRRSWLDMGTAVPVGTTNTYLAENTTLHQPVYASYLPGRFGQSTLPGQFDLPFQDNPRGPISGGIFSDAW